MPFYVIILTVSGNEQSEGLFEATDDSHAITEFPKNIPRHLIGVQRQLSYRRCEFDALEYRPRMARPQLGTSSFINIPGHGPLYIMAENNQMQLPHNANSLSASVNQLAILVDEIKDIFRSVEPDQANMAVYGHKIRNTLLIAAMEFENECKGVLTANGYAPAGGAHRWSTVDFVKVLQPLRLAEYEVKFRHYPNIQPRRPFSSWNSQAATRSLPWYDAYNAVKHDRELNFGQSTIENAIDAVAACAIMLSAEYRVIYNWKDQVGDFFLFSEYPEWPLEQRYVNRIRPNHPMQWSPVLYIF